MRFGEEDRLEDGEVRDLVAWVREPIPDGGVGPVDAAANDGSGPVVDALDTAMPDGRQGDSANPDKMDAGSVLDATADARDAAPPSGCTRRNARVGWKADLGINTGEGQVSGFVTMVDDCTLELTSFSYDGNGIEVRVYGSKSSTFRPGFTIGPDLVGRVFNKAVLRVTLPAGKTLDDLDWVSIWCVKAGANFGSGPFLQP